MWLLRVGNGDGEGVRMVMKGQQSDRSVGGDGTVLFLDFDDGYTNIHMR